MKNNGTIEVLMGEVSEERTQSQRELPAGTLRVGMTQPLARLAFYLIEPRSDDGLVDWNLLDEALVEGREDVSNIEDEELTAPSPSA